jgi:hypothetical protein
MHRPPHSLTPSLTHPSPNQPTPNQTHPRPPLAHSLRRLACVDISLENGAATARLGRILSRLPRLAALALPNAQINDKGLGQVCCVLRGRTHRPVALRAFLFVYNRAVCVCKRPSLSHSIHCLSTHPPTHPPTPTHPHMHTHTPTTIHPPTHPQMLEALLSGCPPEEEESMAATHTAGYSVSCVTSLRALDLGAWDMELMVCVCVRVCIYMYAYACMCVCYVCVCMCVCVYMYAYAYTCV